MSSFNLGTTKWLKRARDRLPRRQQGKDANAIMKRENNAVVAEDTDSIYAASTVVNSGEDIETMSISSFSTLTTFSPVYAPIQEPQQSSSNKSPATGDTKKDKAKPAPKANCAADNGWILMVAQLDAEVFQKHLRTAKKGDVESQVALGDCFYHGQGTKKNYVKAASWYRKAAEKGDAAGHQRLGHIYHCGCGVEQDFVKSVIWFRKAAEQGDRSAQYSLGTAYVYGMGVETDYDNAVYWRRKAAEQGYPYAQSSLGYMYQFGFGVAKDLQQAIHWYSMAAEQNFADSKQVLAQLLVQNNK